MAQGRERSEWNRTSHVLAWIQNWSGFADRMVQGRELDPYREDEPETGPTIDAADLALMICGQAAVDYFAKLDAQQQMISGEINGGK